MWRVVAEQQFEVLFLWSVRKNSFQPFCIKNERARFIIINIYSTADTLAPSLDCDGGPKVI